MQRVFVVLDVRDGFWRVSLMVQRQATMAAARRLLLVSLPVAAILIVILEFGFFRYFVRVDNFPIASYDRTDQILRYLPHQSGVRYPDRDRRHPVRYSINEDGWNSARESYPRARSSRRRIAVIGDSFVEAFQVDPSESASARLEALLGHDATEVYSFGISGAPLSQHLHMARYVSRTFHPDAIVIVVIHNDFIESYRPKPAQFSASFLGLEMGEAIREIPPLPYQGRPIAQWLLARSATLRFGFYAWRTVTETAEAPAAPGHIPSRFEANIDVTELDAEGPRIERATGYLFDQFAQLERAKDTPLLFVMDAPREALYFGKNPREMDVYRLNLTGRAGASRTGLSWVDLTDAFVADYARYRERFDFATDNHWNARGHDVAARELARRLTHLSRHPI